MISGYRKVRGGDLLKLTFTDYVLGQKIVQISEKKRSFKILEQRRSFKNEDSAPFFQGVTQCLAVRQGAAGDLVAELRGVPLAQT